MSLTSVLNNASSGLIAAQAGLRTASDNIANVNTPGYVRKAIDQTHRIIGGAGAGTEVSGVRRIVDQFLVSAGLTAASTSSRWSLTASTLDNAQSLFGDPTSDTGYFAALDRVWSTFDAAAQNPTSGILKSQSVAVVEDFFNQTSRINTQIGQMVATADARAVGTTQDINDILSQIARLNTDISRASIGNGDATGAENVQSGLIDKLATLIDIKVQPRSAGGVTIRSSEGFELTGDAAATLVYRSSDSTPGYLAVKYDVGGEQPITVTGGEMRGLLDLRDIHLPGLSEQLGEFASRAAERLNAAHNASSAAPAKSLLEGRDTGLDLPTAVGGFTGAATLAVTNASGVIQRRVDIDFTAGTLSVDGGAATAFTPATFLASLNTALGAFGTATYTNRGLTLNAASPNGIAMDEGTSQKAGRGFSHFFGLNDLVKSSGQTSYETGLRASDPHGFTAGDTLTFRLTQSDGRPIRDVTVAVPAAATMTDLLAALNANTTGVGLIGAFALDAQGQMSFTPSTTPPVNLSIAQDLTSRGAGGPSISGLFGLGVIERNSRADRLFVDPKIVQNPNMLALSKLDLTVAAGQPAIRPGDGSGARALAAAGETPTGFDAVGALGALTVSLSDYAAQFGASIGRQAESADSRRMTTEAVSSEVAARRQSVEGVNIDEELVRLTTYQQAFNASARMIQAAKELFDVLTNII
ncbi:flagellar hook-associated protein FlgK [Phenylobacterium sp.]|uniref:flagellar hook-associated protein FlgK n=1 Tax=Phenylobacterium sp. TaxID=1871053 RepID=UPI0037C8DB74